MFELDIKKYKKKSNFERKDIKLYCIINLNKIKVKELLMNTKTKKNELKPLGFLTITILLLVMGYFSNQDYEVRYEYYKIDNNSNVIP